MRLFVGIDWATQKHDVCVEAPDGRVLAERTIEHSGQGLATLADWLTGLVEGQAAAIAVAIEVPHGPVVETLLERGCRVHACNPKQLDRFRDRFTVAGAKDDARDARVLADSLRTDGHAFRLLEVDAPAVIELREWSRMTTDLQHERTRLTNRLREQLRRYFPAALAIADDPGKDWFLALLALVPSPDAAQGTAEAAVQTVLKAHRIRRVGAAAVLDRLRQQPVTVAPGTVEAATAHIELLSDRLRLVNRQLKTCQRQLDTCIEQLAPPVSDGSQGEGPVDELSDATILRTLPGIGRIVLATLLAEASRPLRRRDYHAVRSQSGIAPVTRRSGKRTVVLMRKACNGHLRDAVYHWARVAAQCDPHWKTRYATLRGRGHSHGRACRGIADRLLKIAITMLQTRTCYDATRIAA